MDDLPTRSQLERQFNESGEKDKLRELLIQRLKETGWNKKVQDESRRIVQEKGVDTVSLQQLVQDVTPFARKQVPVEVKHEILQLMKKFIEDKSGVEL